jgi:Ca2+-binding EF-hand superfamily protein
MRAPGANPSEEEVDGHREGKTTFTEAEYLAIMDRQKMHEAPGGILEAAFTIFDAEGKGVVDTAELRSVIGNLGERFQPEEIGQMMLMAEINSEGKMSIADLIKFCNTYK